MHEILVWTPGLPDGRSAVTIIFNGNRTVRRKRFSGAFQVDAPYDSHIAGPIPMIQGTGKGPVLFSKIGIEFNGDQTELIRPDTGKLTHRGERVLNFTGDRTGAALARGFEFDGSGSLTCEAWLTPDERTFSHAVSMCNLSDVALLSLTVDNSEKWRFRLFDTSVGKLYAAKSIESVAYGKRTHVAGIYTPGRMELFVDGKYGDESGWFHIRPKGKELRIGADFYGGKRNHFFQGDIHQIRISKGERYQQNFTPAEKLESDDDVMALYNLDEGSGFLLNDASGNNNNTAIGKELNWQPKEQ